MISFQKKIIYSLFTITLIITIASVFSSATSDSQNSNSGNNNPQTLNAAYAYITEPSLRGYVGNGDKVLIIGTVLSSASKNLQARTFADGFIGTGVYAQPNNKTSLTVFSKGVPAENTKGGQWMTLTSLLSASAGDAFTLMAASTDDTHGTTLIQTQQDTTLSGAAYAPAEFSGRAYIDAQNTMHFGFRVIGTLDVGITVDPSKLPDYGLIVPTQYNWWLSKYPSGESLLAGNQNDIVKHELELTDGFYTVAISPVGDSKGFMIASITGVPAFQTPTIKLSSDKSADTNKIQLNVGDKITINGQISEVRGLNHDFIINWVYDSAFFDNNCLTARDIAADTISMTCTATKAGMTNIYAELKLNGQTYTSNNVGVAILPKITPHVSIYPDFLIESDIGSFQYQTSKLEKYPIYYTSVKIANYDQYSATYLTNPELAENSNQATVSVVDGKDENIVQDDFSKNLGLDKNIDMGWRRDINRGPSVYRNIDTSGSWSQYYYTWLNGTKIISVTISGENLLLSDVNNLIVRYLEKFPSTNFQDAKPVVNNIGITLDPDVTKIQNNIGDVIKVSSTLQSSGVFDIKSANLEIYLKNNLIYTQNAGITCTHGLTGSCEFSWNTGDGGISLGENTYTVNVTFVDLNGNKISKSIDYTLKFKEIDQSLCKEVIPGHNNAQANRANIVFVEFVSDNLDLNVFYRNNLCNGVGLEYCTALHFPGSGIKSRSATNVTVTCVDSLNNKHLFTLSYTDAEKYDGDTKLCNANTFIDPPKKNIREISAYLIDSANKNYGLLSVEPFKSNVDKFNFWYVDKVGSYSELSTTGTDKENFAANCVLPNKYVTYLIDAPFRSYTNFGTSSITQLSAPASYISEIVAGTYVHETGHQIGWLEDEYVEISGSSYTTSGENLANCYGGTQHTKDECSQTAPWKSMIGDGCGLPGVIDCHQGDTNYSLEVGCFEGCYYTEFGIFRPTFNTIMRNTFSEPYSYGPWDEKLIYDRIKGYSG